MFKFTGNETFQFFVDVRDAFVVKSIVSTDKRTEYAYLLQLPQLFDIGTMPGGALNNTPPNKLGKPTPVRNHHRIKKIQDSLQPKRQ